MIVEARLASFEEAPDSLRKEGYAPESHVEVTVHKTYEVHAMSVWRGIAAVLIADDYEVPRFLPAWLFRTVDATIPEDWICNLFHSELSLVIGPAFISGSEDEYNRMVESELDQTTRFYRRLDSKPL